MRARKLLYLHGMKIFGTMLFAILVAAGIFYLTHQQQETTVAHDASDAKMRRTRALLPGYGAPPGDTPQPVASPIPPEEVSVTPTAALELKIQTIDGPVIIPKGTVLRILPEKSKPGTVVINYEGYSFTIPSTAIASESH